MQKVYIIKERWSDFLINRPQMNVENLFATTSKEKAFSKLEEIVQSCQERLNKRGVQYRETELYEDPDCKILSGIGFRGSNVERIVYVEKMDLYE